MLSKEVAVYENKGGARDRLSTQTRVLQSFVRFLLVRIGYAEVRIGTFIGQGVKKAWITNVYNYNIIWLA
jgi:hypothetical protein